MALIAKKKKRDLSRPAKRPERPSIPLATALRMFLVGSLAVVAATWAVWRHVTTPRMPMMEPVPAASEIPVEVEATP